MKKLLFLGLFFSLAKTGFSTTTTSTRNINIDGIVTTSSSPGTNNGNWETDEVYQGYQGIVNWYLTWDDNNLYMGRKGFTSSNQKGSVINIRAQYNGDGNNFNMTGFNYDGVTPDFSKMGGINFIAYMKDNYDEYRTWNGTSWTASNTSLTPIFNNSGGEDHMEVTIPWNKITNGNGKPMSIRISMFQINLADNRCPGQPFVFSESPWGKGTETGSPTLGVNDGAPTTTKTQPGGCNVQAASIERWWGCYPIISGVASNGFVAMAPDAGADQNICETTTSTTLSGNEPSADAIGTWSYIASRSTPGITAPSITDIHNKNTTVTGMLDDGKYVFAWDINYGGCPSVPDTIVVTRWKKPSVADAGNDTSLCLPQNSTVLHGNVPVTGNGIWKLVQGTGVISNVNSSSPNVTGLSTGLNKFQWKIGNGPTCDSTSDVVTITVNTLPRVINPPRDSIICRFENASFSISGTGTGLNYQWQVSASGTTDSFVNLSNNTTYNNVNSPTLVISSADTSLNGFYYRCYVTGACPPADTSASARLTVKMHPVIIAQPTSEVKCVGEKVAFRVRAIGNNLQYQWKKNGLNIQDAITDSLIIPLLTTADSGNYTVTITGDCSPAVTSSIAKLSINTLPSVISHPENIVSCPGESVMFKVKATGSGLSFQWQEKKPSGNFSDINNDLTYNISSQNDSSILTVSGLKADMNGYQYRCLVSGICSPGDTSNAGLLNINTLEISTHSTDTTICENNDVHFFVQALGTALTYQWLVSADGHNYTSINDGAVYSGTASSQLNLNQPPVSFDGYKYRCIVKSSCDNVSFITDTTSAITLNINALSKSGTGISSKSPVCINENTEIKLNGFTGKIQWQQSNDGISWVAASGGNGSDSSSYLTPALSDTIYYRAITTNGVCASDTLKNIVKIDVNPASVAGTAAATRSPICINENTEIVLSGSTGKIQWEQSDDAVLWTKVAGGISTDSSVYVTPALTDTIFYRALVTSGVCSTDTTNAFVKVEVSPSSVAGNAVSARSPVCINENAEIRLTGYTGKVQWQQSSNGLVGWGPVSGGLGADSSIYVTPALQDTIYYRAIVTSGVCTSDTTAQIVKIEVSPASVAGNALVVKSPVCFNESTEIKLTGSTGRTEWQESSNGSTGWQNVTAGTGKDSTIYNTPKLSTTTFYRAIVTSGVCKADTLITPVKVEVTPVSVAGTATSAHPAICNLFSSEVKLSGYTGDILWEQSNTENGPWNPVTGGNGQHSNVYSTPTLEYTIFYRAKVKNGVCSAVITTPLKITVYPKTHLDLGNDTVVCEHSSITLKPEGAFNSYLWSNNSTASYNIVYFPGTYSLKVIDQNGCEERDTIRIENCGRFFIPDIITPNNDDLNDAFIILGNQQGSTLDIYNRWGIKIYSSYDYNNSWDGGDAPDGTYYYVYTLNKAVYTGWVAIVRSKNEQVE